MSRPGSSSTSSVGFLLAGLFVLLYDSLPGGCGWLKGIGFAVIIWFLRVVMSVACQWMMYTVPPAALLYTLLTGLGGMLVLGTFVRFFSNRGEHKKRGAVILYGLL